MAARWMQKEAAREQKAGTKGDLHRALGIPKDKNIPWSRIVAAAKKKGRLGRMARMAMRYAGK